MTFSFKEQKDEKCFEISLKEGCLENFKQSHEKYDGLAIDFASLNLGESLFGKTKRETRQIQKGNYKKLTALYRLVKKFLKFTHKNNVNFDGVFYVHGLSQKKNNNDFMLASMLNLKYNVKSKKYKFIIESTCEYLDKENALNNICGNFQGGRCRKQTEINVSRYNGCCSKHCKYFVKGQPCKVRSVACKLFICDYQKERGYIFFTEFIPLLRQHLTLFERLQISHMLFKNEEQTAKLLRTFRFLNYFALAALLGLFSLVIAAACV